MTGFGRRSAAALLSLWFLAGGVGHAVGAHHCPHHDGGAPAPHADPSGHAPAAGHSHPAGVEHPAGDPSAAHGPCTCVGRCHAGAAPTFAVPYAAGTPPVTDAPALSFPAPPPPIRPAIVPFSLPWGNAPPVR